MYNPIEYSEKERGANIDGKETVKTKPGIYIFDSKMPFLKMHCDESTMEGKQEYNQLRFYIDGKGKTPPENKKWKWWEAPQKEQQ